MEAVILAAGRGSRLGELTKNKPKCLLELNTGFTVIDYIIQVLTKEVNVSLSSIYVVVGYKHECFEKYKQYDINLIKNDYYDKYENMFSLYLALKEISSDFILVNSDVVFHKELLSTLKDTDSECSFFVIDNVEELSEEDMKVIIHNNRIIKFGKNIPLPQAHGEYIGLAKILKKDADVMYSVFDEFVKQKRTYLWYEDVFNELTDTLVFRPVFTQGLPWTEIDTLEDYINARNLIRRLI